MFVFIYSLRSLLAINTLTACTMKKRVEIRVAVEKGNIALLLSLKYNQ